MPTAALMRSSFAGADEESYRRFAGDAFFRLSVGIEDPADIIEDLGACLHRLGA